jgi:dipeptidyl aminopeptidase/acylaminoacyl peptidase
MGRSHKGSFTWRLRKEDVDDRLSTDMSAACSQIQKTAVLTVHGDADADVPVADAMKFDQLIQVSQRTEALCVCCEPLTGCQVTWWCSE